MIVRRSALDAAACKVEFGLDYAFAGVVMTPIAGPVFGRMANTLVDAFVRRALAAPGASLPGISAQDAGRGR